MADFTREEVEAIVRKLRGAYLRGGGNLLGADLREANLRMFKLQDANLSGADLSDADDCRAALRDRLPPRHLSQCPHAAREPARHAACKRCGAAQDVCAVRLQVLGDMPNHQIADRMLVDSAGFHSIILHCRRRTIPLRPILVDV